MGEREMSKALADRLQEVAEYLVLTRNIGTHNSEVLAEAIAALRSEPVAWIQSNHFHQLKGQDKFAVMCRLANHKLMTDFLPLYAAPSRDECKHGTSFRYVCEQCDSESREDQRSEAERVGK